MKTLKKVIRSSGQLYLIQTWNLVATKVDSRDIDVRNVGQVHVWVEMRVIVSFCKH